MSNLPIITELKFPDLSKIIDSKTEFIDSEALFDYKNNYLQYEGGNIVFGLDQTNEYGVVNKRERAVTAWIEKILRTEINKFKIYEKDEDGAEEYGTKFHLYVGSVFPNNVIKPLFANEFERALMRLEEIETILDIEVELEKLGSQVHTSGLVIRKDGTVPVDMEV